MPNWSPDGRGILYYRQPGLRIIAPDGTGDRELLGPFVVDGARFQPGLAIWAPDGRTIYFKAGTADAAAIWALSASGGPPRRVVQFDNPDRPSGRPEIATDGERLYFTVVNRQSDIWLMSVEPRQ